MKRLYKILIMVVLAAQVLSCTERTEPPTPPSLSLEVSEVSSSGCKVEYVLSDNATYYKSMIISAEEYAAIGEAGLLSELESQNISYARVKRVFELYGSDFIVAALAYNEEHTHGELCIERFALVDFAVDCEMFLKESEDELQNQHNSIYVKISTCGRAQSGRLCLVKTSLLTDQSSMKVALDTAGRAFSKVELEGFDGQPEIDEYSYIFTSLEDGVSYSLVTEFVDSKGETHLQQTCCSTAEIILLDGYKKLLGKYRQSASTWMTVSRPNVAIKDIQVEVSILEKNKSFLVKGLSAALSSFQNISLDSDEGGEIDDTIVATYTTDGRINLFPQDIKAQYNGNRVRFMLIERRGGALIPYTESNIYLSGWWEENRLLFLGRYGNSEKENDYDGYTFVYDRYNGTGSVASDFSKVNTYISPRLLSWEKISQ